MRGFGPNRRRDRVGLLAPAIAIMVMATSGCAPRGVDIPPGADALEPCEALPPIKVDALASRGAPGCDMEGVVLVYPDGRELEVTPVGVAAGSSSTDRGGEIQLVNWGVPGVGATYLHRGEAEVWGSTDEAVDLQRQQLAVDGIDPEDITSGN